MAIGHAQARQWPGVVALVICCALWSLNGPLIKLLNEQHVPGVTVAFFRSLIGGLVGVAFGFTASQILDQLAEQLTTAVTLDIVLLSTGISAMVGLFFGIYPASRAANLNPIDALRYE